MSKATSKSKFVKEDVVQAVIIADSAHCDLSILSIDKPQCLFPLINVPLIEYALESLISNGVQEVYVFCSRFAEQIRRHIEESKWSRNMRQFSVQVLSSTSYTCLGEIMRDVDAKGLIKNDFILMRCGAIANIDMKKLLTTHSEKRVKERSLVMTMVYRAAVPGHMSRQRNDDVIMALHRDSGKVLYHKNYTESRNLDIPLNVFTDQNDFDIRYDLLDTGMALCSPVVPQIFTDNFDYLTKDDFVRGIFVDQEIHGNSLHVHVVEDGYACCVGNVKMYKTVSQDVVQRWSYPLVPDNNISDQEDTEYNCRRHNVYTHNTVKLSRNCQLKRNVVIDAGSCVGSKSSIMNSVLGSNCRIGDNVRITGSCLWGNVQVEDGCVIEDSVLADDVQLKGGVTLSPGCVLASSVIVGPAVKLPQGTRVTATPLSAGAGTGDGFSDDDEADTTTTKAISVDHSLVGTEGVGYINCSPLQDTDIKDEEDSISNTDLSDDNTEGSLDEGENMEEIDDAKLFYDEVISTLERALEEGISPDNMVLEINSLKHAYNIQIQELNSLVVRAVVALAAVRKADIAPKQYVTEFKSLLNSVRPVFQNYIRSQQSQRDCVNGIEMAALEHTAVWTAAMQVLKLLYDQDILSEDTLLQWHAAPPPEGAPRDLRKQVQPFIEWLQEADEESTESD